MPVEAKRQGSVDGVTHVNPAWKFHAAVVDRDPMSSHNLAQVLSRELRCKAMAASSETLLQELAGGNVSLVAIGADLKLGVGSGFNLAYAVYRAFPDVRIIMLLDQITPAAVISSFRSGARGVFCRQGTMGELTHCIDLVRKGLLGAGKTEIDFLLEAFISVPAPVVSTDTVLQILTERELQVVRLAAQGQTNKTIAVDLGLSEHTVKNYLFRAFEKLGVSNRIELLFSLVMRGHDLVGPGQNSVPEKIASA